MGRRLVLLVRHGQYDLDLGDDGGLTPTGIEQAKATAALLKGYQPDVAVASNLPRARQTAEILADIMEISFKHTALIREGFPTKVPGRPGKQLIEKDRFEKAFEKYFKVGRQKRAVTLLVCHGNIIRYFVCRALGIPVRKWLSLGTNHGAVTRIVVQSDGRMGVAAFNEASHFEQRLIT